MSELLTDDGCIPVTTSSSCSLDFVKGRRCFRGKRVGSWLRGFRVLYLLISTNVRTGGVTTAALSSTLLEAISSSHYYCKQIKFFCILFGT